MLGWEDSHPDSPDREQFLAGGKGDKGPWVTASAFSYPREPVGVFANPKLGISDFI